MCSKRDTIIFLAGVEAFHTISHIAIGLTHILPIEICKITVTYQLNLMSIIINGLITAGLLWWASRLK